MYVLYTLYVSRTAYAYWHVRCTPSIGMKQEEKERLAIQLATMSRDRAGGPVHLGLTRDQIIRAAIDLVERDGEAGLSMRRVAAELGASPMSLYNHVPNKAALLDGMAEYILQGVESAGIDPGQHWSERARALMRAYRKMSLDYPRAVSLVHTRQAESPAAMRSIEHALALADDAGFDGETSIRIMRAMLAYAAGSQIRDFSSPRPPEGQPGKDEGLQGLDPDEFPHVHALRSQLLRPDPEADFEFGLDLLIGAVTRLARKNDGAARN